MIINDTDAIALLYSYTIFVIYIFFALKFLKRKELLFLLLCALPQVFFSIFVEPIGWVTGLWEFAFDRVFLYEVYLEAFYAASVFFTNWMLLGSIYLFLKKHKLFFPYYLIVHLFYICLGTYMDVFVEPFYTNPLLVIVLWSIGSITYLLTFHYLYKRMFKII